MDIKLNRMDVKPNRPVRVGNQMMRSGEGGREFHEQVDAALADAGPGEDPLAQFVAEISEALSAVNAKVDDLQTQLQDVVKQIADLAKSNAQLGSDLAAAISTVATLSDQVASLQQPAEGERVAEPKTAEPKSTAKAAKAD